MQFKHHIPKEPLRSFVKSIFYYSEYCGNSKYEIILPDGEPQLVITLDDSIRRVKTNIQDNASFIELKKSWLKGIFSKPVMFESEQDSAVLCIQFEPFGLSRLLGIPAIEHLESFVPSDLTFGSSINTLREQLFETNSFNEKIVLVENYLKNKLKTTTLKETFVETILKNQKFTNMSLSNLKENTGYSKKHIISKFKEQVGLTPKSYQRLLNINEAILLLSKLEHSNYTHIAHDCGFYDQSHFIKNFKLITGITPKNYLSAKQVYPHVLNVD